MLTVTIAEQGRQERSQAFEHFPVRIGRAPGNHLMLQGWKVGKVHAEIQQLGNAFKLVDRGSLVGTWVNSERIVEYGPLNDTDEISIAGFKLRVQPSLPGISFTAAIDWRHRELFGGIRY
jgi:pilus assembly protein CpaF